VSGEEKNWEKCGSCALSPLVRTRDVKTVHTGKRPLRIFMAGRFFISDQDCVFSP
jgi:hypothetical protein